MGWLRNLGTFTRFHGPQLLLKIFLSSFHFSDALIQPRKASSQSFPESLKYSRKAPHSSNAPASTYLKSPSTFIVSWFPFTCSTEDLAKITLTQQLTELSRWKYSAWASNFWTQSSTNLKNCSTNIFCLYIQQPQQG